MSDERNVGSAFPHKDMRLNVPGGYRYEASPGMSLRDYFAGQALSLMKIRSLLNGFEVVPPLSGLDTQQWQLMADLAATHAYRVADAMLKAREAA